MSSAEFFSKCFQLQDFYRCINDHNLDGIQEMFDNGFDVNSEFDNDNLLFKMIKWYTSDETLKRKTKMDVIRLLLKNGINVNKVFNGCTVPCCACSTTALCCAAMCGDIEVIQLLIDNGAEIDSLPGRISPLIFAVAYNEPEAVQYLIGKGCNLNAKNMFGKTALQIANEMEYYSIAEMIEAK